MNLKNQCVNLELSKRLKELGIKQESYFYWNICHDCAKEYPSVEWELEAYIRHGENVSAFTATELGDMLPNIVSIKNGTPFDDYRIEITKFISVDEKRNQTNNYIINYKCTTTEVDGENAWLARHLTNNIYDPNLANAMAKMLIFLIENNLVTVK